MMGDLDEKEEQVCTMCRVIIFSFLFLYIFEAVYSQPKAGLNHLPWDEIIQP